METIAERLLFLIKSKGYNQKEFAKLIGVGDSKVSGWVNGEHAPNYESILSIIKEFNLLNLYWLILGEGEMWIKNETSIVEEPKTEYHSGEIRNMQRTIDTQEKIILMLERENERLKKEKSDKE